VLKVPLNPNQSISQSLFVVIITVACIVNDNVRGVRDVTDDEQRLSW